jgi:Protein of unknown function (DUF2934)
MSDMKKSDHDGKSKTASSVRATHYPEQHEVENSGFEEIDSLPTHEQIARRAFDLWQSRGYPRGSEAQDWMEAEEELRAAVNSRNALKPTAGRSGSVQR